MKLLLILIISLIFGGCGAKPSVAPDMKMLDNPTFPHEDLMFEGKKYHAYTEDQHQYMIGTSLNLGITANQCIEILQNIRGK